jgi:hypothetical protein
MARTDLSLAAVVSPSDSDWYIARVMAFFLSGRSKASVAMPSAMWNFMDIFFALFFEYGAAWIGA